MLCFGSLTKEQLMACQCFGHCRAPRLPLFPFAHEGVQAVGVQGVLLLGGNVRLGERFFQHKAPLVAAKPSEQQKSCMPVGHECVCMGTMWLQGPSFCVLNQVWICCYSGAVLLGFHSLVFCLYT